ncbi:MAG: hypothetical protein WD075_11880 [Rhodospirillales bacterium]
MLARLLALIGLGGPEHDARVLARDANALIDMLHKQHGTGPLIRIAGEARLQIAEVHRRGLNDTQYYRRGVEHLTELNRAARSRHDSVTWSGITLAIIYIKAEMLGELGLPAQNAIDGYIDKWFREPDGEAPESRD